MWILNYLNTSINYSLKRRDLRSKLGFLAVPKDKLRFFALEFTDSKKDENQYPSCVVSFYLGDPQIPFPLKVNAFTYIQQMIRPDSWHFNFQYCIVIFVFRIHLYVVVVKGRLRVYTFLFYLMLHLSFLLLRWWIARVVALACLEYFLIFCKSNQNY